MAKKNLNSVTTKKISEVDLEGPIEGHPEKQKVSKVVVENVVPKNQDLEKNDYQNHPKFAKFNNVGGQ